MVGASDSNGHNSLPYFGQLNAAPMGSNLSVRHSSHSSRPSVTPTNSLPLNATAINPLSRHSISHETNAPRLMGPCHTQHPHPPTRSSSIQQHHSRASIINPHQGTAILPSKFSQLADSSMSAAAPSMPSAKILPSTNHDITTGP